METTTSAVAQNNTKTSVAETESKSEANVLKEFFEMAHQESLEVVQMAMFKNELLKCAQSFVKEPKMLLMAGLIVGHGQEMLLEGTTEEVRLVLANALVDAAKPVVKSFQAEGKVDMSKWNHFKKAFSAWQTSDKKQVVDALVAEYRKWTETMQSIKEKDAEAIKEWQPHIIKQQDRIRSILKRIQAEAVLELDSSGLNLKAVHEMALDPKNTYQRIFASSKKETKEVLLTEEHIHVLKDNKAVMVDFAVHLLEYMQKQLELLAPQSLDKANMDLDVKGARVAFEARPDSEGVLEELVERLLACLNTLSDWCAPARDAEIAALKGTHMTWNNLPMSIQSLDSLLRGIRHDLAKYHMASIAPVIEKTAVEYERHAFNKTKINDSYRRTEAWLRKYKSVDDLNETWATAMSDLLIEADLREKALPETLVLDRERLERISKEMQDAISKATTKVKKEIFSDKEDPVYRLMQKRSQEDLKSTLIEAIRNDQQKTVKRKGPIRKSASVDNLLVEMRRFAKLHWSIHKDTYERVYSKL